MDIYSFAILAKRQAEGHRAGMRCYSRIFYIDGEFAAHQIEVSGNDGVCGRIFAFVSARLDEGELVARGQ
jgi:hypothetical protein